MSRDHRLILCTLLAALSGIIQGVALAQQSPTLHDPFGPDGATENPFEGPPRKPEIKIIAEAPAQGEAEGEQSHPAPAGAINCGVPVLGDSQAHARIRHALERPADVDFVEVPLSDVVEFFKDSAGIPIMMDKRALDEVGLGSDTPVTISLKGITLRSTLRILLRELDLTYVVRDSVLKITTPEEAESERDTRLYAVADLAASEPLPVIVTGPAQPFALLEDIVLSTIQPDSWARVGGAGSFEPFAAGGFVAISQSEQVHEQIAALLGTIRRARAAEMETKQDAQAWPVTREVDLQAQLRIAESLKRDATLEFRDAPLSEVVEFLHDAFEMPLYIDHRALDDVGLGSDTPVTMSLQGIALRSALRLMLKELDLTYVVADEVLMITTPEEAENRLVICVYPIGDLTRPQLARHEKVPADSPNSLTNMITSCIAPDSWDVMGGAGTIELAPAWGLMVVSQTQEVQQQVAGLLTAARRVRAGGGEKPGGNGFGELFGGSPRDPSETMVLSQYTLSDEASVEEVKAMIEGAVEPSSWHRLPHPAAIFPLGHKLVILQTPAAHKRIEELLRATGAAAFGGHPFAGGGGFF